VATDPPFDLGTPGSSGRREYERRKAKREAAMRAKHPRVGGLLLKLQEPPQHEQAWASGAAGEEALADSLARRSPEALVLHDRRLPGRRTNIDHLAVAPSGVYVIDAKRYKGTIEVQKPLFGKEKLVIAGRDKTKLVEGLKRQVEAVRKGLALIESTAPLHGCFCFINPPGQAGGSGIPLLRTLTVEGHPLYYPKRLAKRLNQSGELTPGDILVVAEALAELFPAA
jgi:Nuclease-related domain